jgi:hypothetical protein
MINVASNSALLDLVHSLTTLVSGERGGAQATHLQTSLAAFGDDAPGLIQLVAPLFPLCGGEDQDVRWAIARVVAAIGTPWSRDPFDRGAIQQAILHAQHVAQVKKTRYYRIGDSTWTLYVVVALWVSPSGEIAFLFPAAKGKYVLDPAIPSVSLEGHTVPWPPFTSPLFEHLLSGDDRSGFVSEERAVHGNARLPPPVTPHTSS